MKETGNEPLFPISDVTGCQSQVVGLFTLMMGVMNSSRKLWRSNDGQLWWMKLISRPLMWEPS